MALKKLDLHKTALKKNRVGHLALQNAGNIYLCQKAPVVTVN